MFRTVIVNIGEKIRLSNNWVVIEDNGETNSIPLDDIYSIVIDNQHTTLSLGVINALTSNGAHVILCDDKHMPASIVLPNNTYYRPLTRINQQINISDDLRNELWNRIITAKIINQANILEECVSCPEAVARMRRLVGELTGDDDKNCEGVAAKLFFRNMYGADFLRFNDDIINAALNYGYAIIRSSMAKTLVSHGFNCTIGIHHKNIYNAFNLADDMMEPFRPMVDLWVSNHSDNLADELSKENRRDLVNLVNVKIMVNDVTTSVRNVIENYVVSFAKAIESGDAEFFNKPIIQTVND